MTITADDDDNTPVLVAAVEGGGTTFVVAVAELGGGPTPKIHHRKEIDSSKSAQETLANCVKLFQKHKPAGGYHALGIASFGPVGVKETEPNVYDSILGSPPKASWPLLSYRRSHFATRSMMTASELTSNMMQRKTWDHP